MNLALLKKYLALEICGAVILVALMIIGVKLFAAIRQYTAEKSALQAVMDRKQRLDRRTPYPSMENVKQEAENFKDLLDSYNELNEMLRARQIEPQVMQPAEFMPLLENSLRRLRSQLSSARVIYPPKFTFGFGRYAGGKLPAPGDISLLVQQLKIVDALCQALGKVGVADLVSIARNEFELSGRPVESDARNTRGVPSPAGSPSSGKTGNDALYTTQHFKLVVKANEAAIFDLLNLLARLPMFTVVTLVEMENQKQSFRDATGAPAPAAAGGAAEESAVHGKIILGKELVDLSLELDVYQFAPSLNFKENAGKK
ncbi:MAG: Amuc_1100 family pilus-like protein [Verrucomicrobia bacterium]|nr:Amuc_1100 family pilus-like protein [Verrucomicrobiota bacterium]MBU4247821.1 Amuc_1100 family pilus-like protein [Verrucomicrobiota bacterium]MBU4291951.1 Amuc_1100 family pilus-like protein [Verrucomicrobiota bacterium]MBU4498301.1 Amuc_1100 family pilus-like protein [Verrucomicrobiota bacterium]MCG2678422.1 Amuc_1100 family pilus-like protein [Kiritimatiellia bacterium]